MCGNTQDALGRLLITAGIQPFLIVIRLSCYFRIEFVPSLCVLGELEVASSRIMTESPECGPQGCMASIQVIAELGPSCVEGRLVKAQKKLIETKLNRFPQYSSVDGSSDEMQTGLCDARQALYQPSTPHYHHPLTYEIGSIFSPL